MSDGKLAAPLAAAMLAVLATISAPAQTSFIPRFDIKPNDLAITRIPQATQYFDKIGPRAGLMGYESGEFELWIWPWKVLKSFQLSFLTENSTKPLRAGDIVREISVSPEVTTFTYTYESFTVREHILIPRDEPGAILLLDVYTTVPLKIVGGFLPVMQPMWPAGVGGQFSYWDDHAYVISEGQWRAIFLCGSPAAAQMAAPPAHMFADNPLEFTIDVVPGETGTFIPIVIAGALPDPVSHKMSIDSVKKTFARLSRNAEFYYHENVRYFEKLRRSTLQVISPDRETNLAFEWAKISLDNLFVANPNLGRGMVAGYGLSGSGARPGFAWFFGGDAFINSLAIDAYGDFDKVRDALAFTQKWQRKENFPVRKPPGTPAKDIGKMAHELSQSDGDLCDWWNDYHYGYNHADTTPWYIVAMGDYVRTSGDTVFLRKSWSSVKEAYSWCLSKDSDDDGLMDLKGAGLGALEFGKLVGIYADIYTCGVWTQAVKEITAMADLMGDAGARSQAERQLAKATQQLEKKFWMGEEGYYSYGATQAGEQVHDKTPWPALPMMFGLLDRAKTAKSLEHFNAADLCTDWGVRSLSNSSKLFEPSNYNYGAVWPFIASFFNTAQFKYHESLAGRQILKANIRHAFDHAAGSVPELFSGDVNEKVAEGYHHQGFSTTGYALPLVRGLLGLDVDRLNGKIHFSPHLPPGESWTIGNMVAGGDTVNLFVSDSSWTSGTYSLDVKTRGKDSILVEFDPSIPEAGELTGARLNGKAIVSSQSTGPSDTHVLVEFRVKGSARLDLSVRPRFAVIPEARSSPGSPNQSLRFVTQKFLDRKITLVVEGLSGRSYHIPVIFPPLENPDVPAIPRSVEGARLDPEGFLDVAFEKGRGFVRKNIIITLN